MKIFLDCEFDVYGTRAYLISIALVDEKGEAFYGEVKPAIMGAKPWLDENVFPKLWLIDPTQREAQDPGVTYIAGSEFEIAAMLEGWMAERNEDGITVVGDVYGTDWHLFCNAFGGSFDLPSYISYIPLDLATMLYAYGHDPDVSREEFAGVADASLKHNALFDARILRSCWNKLDKQREKMVQ
jgi:hypothetical protein